MSRLTYETLRGLKSDKFIPSCDGSRTLAHFLLLEERDTNCLSCSIPGLTVIDLNIPSRASERQPVRLIAMSDFGVQASIKLLLQTATEPNLDNNCFTQAQVVEYIENNPQMMRDLEADEIFILFKVEEKGGAERKLVLCLNFVRNSMSGTIYDLEAKIVPGHHNQSVLIKTN